MDNNLTKELPMANHLMKTHSISTAKISVHSDWQKIDISNIQMKTQRNTNCHYQLKKVYDIILLEKNLILS